MRRGTTCRCCEDRCRSLGSEWLSVSAPTWRAQAELASERAELEQQRGRVAQLQQELEAARADGDAKQAKLAEWEGKYNACFAKLQELSEEIDDVRRDAQVQQNTLRNELLGA